MGVVMGVFLGGVGTSGRAVADGFAAGAEQESSDAAADVDAATRCKALPSFLNLVIKFCKCNWAEGRVMCANAASISSASAKRSWERESTTSSVVVVAGVSSSITSEISTMVDLVGWY